MVAMSVLFVAMRQAMDGQVAALALMAAVGLAVGTFLLYGLAFLAAYGANRMLQSLSPKRAAQSPFVVEGEFPPQQVPKNPVQDNM